MLLSSLMAVVYIWRVVEALYFAEPSSLAREAEEAPWRMLVPTYVLVGAVLVFGVWTVYSAGLAAKAANVLLGGSS